jgi:hypothetical protein
VTPRQHVGTARSAGGVFGFFGGLPATAGEPYHARPHSVCDHRIAKRVPYALKTGTTSPAAIPWPCASFGLVQRLAPRHLSPVGSTVPASIRVAPVETGGLGEASRCHPSCATGARFTVPSRRSPSSHSRLAARQNGIGGSRVRRRLLGTDLVSSMRQQRRARARCRLVRGARGRLP